MKSIEWLARDTQLAFPVFQHRLEKSWHHHTLLKSKLKLGFAKTWLLPNGAEKNIVSDVNGRTAHCYRLKWLISHCDQWWKLEWTESLRKNLIDQIYQAPLSTADEYFTGVEVAQKNEWKTNCPVMLCHSILWPFRPSLDLTTTECHKMASVWTHWNEMAQKYSA